MKNHDCLTRSKILLFLVMGCLVALVSGCNLSLSVQTQLAPTSDTVVAIVTTAATSTRVPSATATFATATFATATFATATSKASPTLAVPTAPRPTVITRITNCVPRTDWTIYIVQAGDTLGTLAQRTGTSINQLSEANCLFDPNHIAVGQQLWIPHNSLDFPTPVGPPTPSGTLVGGQLTVAPIVGNDAGWLVLQAGSVVTIAWPYAERLGAVEVNFTLSPPGTGSTPTIIGTDINTTDGASIQWTVPPGGTQGSLEAAAGTMGGRVLVDRTQIPLKIIASPQTDDCPFATIFFGCPITQQTVNVIYQPFQGGHMLWRRDAKQVYVLINDGTWHVFTDTWNEGEPVYPSMPEDGSIPCPEMRPQRGLGKVWFTQSQGGIQPSIRDQLGCPTSAETSYTTVWEEHQGRRGDNTPIIINVFRWPTGVNLVLDPTTGWALPPQ